jgi:HSP20 family protein
LFTEKETTMLFSASALDRQLDRHFQRAARSAYTPTAHAPRFDRWLSDVFSDSLQAPSVKVDSDTHSTTLQLDVPGLAKDQLNITLEDDVVRITSKDDAPRSFKAAYRLAETIDAATSSAALENGVLNVKLGKLAPVSRETSLAIQ